MHSNEPHELTRDSSRSLAVCMLTVKYFDDNSAKKIRLAELLRLVVGSWW